MQTAHAAKIVCANNLNTYDSFNVVATYLNEKIVKFKDVSAPAISSEIDKSTDTTHHTICVTVND